MLIGSLVSPVQAKATALGALLPGDLSRALPYLIRRLWHPVSPHDINAELAEDHAALRSQLRQSMQLYELGVKRVSQHGQATAESIVSAITQLVHHGEGNVQFTQSAAARGLHVAVSSLVQPEVGSVKASHRKTIARLHTAQELVYSCLAYYIPSADTGEPMPMLNIGDCRHSTTLISQALSQHNPISTVPMLRTMTSVAGDKARVGSATAAAMVQGCLRSRFQGMASKLANLPHGAGRRKTQMDRRFHAMLKLAQSFHASEKPPPCLFQAMVTSAIATDLYHWNRMRVLHGKRQAQSWNKARLHQNHRPPVSLGRPPTDSQDLRADIAIGSHVLRPSSDAKWTGTMPVAFVLAHEDSHTHRVLGMRRASVKQCMSDRLAIELLVLARSEDDVSQILCKLVFPNTGHDPFQWVDCASAALTSAAVKQYVVSHAWSAALKVVERTVATFQKDIVGSKQAVMQATIDDPFSLLGITSPTTRLRMEDRPTMVVNTLLCALAAVAATACHDISTPTKHVYKAIELVLRLSQVHSIPLAPHTLKQVFMCALQKQHVDGTVNASSILHAFQANYDAAVPWSTAVQALLLAGDDGRHAVSLLQGLYAHSEVHWSPFMTARVAECAVAVAFAVLRAPGACLPDRLHRFRLVLSAVPASEMDRFKLREQLVRAAAAGFFQHSNSMQDLSQHGFLQLLSELMTAGLPFTGHLQKCLARHKHVLAVALLRRQVPDAAALELKFALERLAVGDAHFAGSAAGRRCMSRAAAARGSTLRSVCHRSAADDTPYQTDGRIASTGFAVHPTIPEDVVADCCQAAASWVRPAGGDLGVLCRQPYQDIFPGPITAEFLSSYAAQLNSVDWLSVTESANRGPMAELVLASGEERCLQQAMELNPVQVRMALQAVSTAFRLMQAVPPE